MSAMDLSRQGAHVAVEIAGQREDDDQQHHRDGGSLAEIQAEKAER